MPFKQPKNSIDFYTESPGRVEVDILDEAVMDPCTIGVGKTKLSALRAASRRLKRLQAQVDKMVEAL